MDLSKFSTLDTRDLNAEHGGKITLLLLQPLIYQYNAQTITVPAGFITDLASIPQPMWVVLPPIGSYDKAAVVHDYLYRYNGVSRLEADQVLLQGMKDLGVPGWKVWTIYAGVRVGGGVRWSYYRNHD